MGAIIGIRMLLIEDLQESQHLFSQVEHAFTICGIRLAGQVDLDKRAIGELLVLSAVAVIGPGKTQLEERVGKRLDKLLNTRC